MSGAKIAFERAHELLAYDPGTGVLSWRVYRGRSARVGPATGRVGHDGYQYLKVDQRSYAAHRLIWFMTTGEWPPHDIDHINGDKLDNRIANLRLATRAQNKQNTRKPQANNVSGALGVAWVKRDRRYVASIGVNGQRIRLGYFTTADEAHKAYLKAKAEVHPFSTLEVPA